eukprot:scaffold1081_cov197-Alexandrium_tamarense.AAC.12
MNNDQYRHHRHRRQPGVHIRCATCTRPAGSSSTTDPTLCTHATDRRSDGHIQQFKYILQSRLMPQGHELTEGGVGWRVGKCLRALVSCLTRRLTGHYPP